MGRMEEISSQRKKRADVQRLILESVALTGFLAIAIVAPNVIGVMEKMGFIPRERQNEYIQNARRN